MLYRSQYISNFLQIRYEDSFLQVLGQDCCIPPIQEMGGMVHKSVYSWGPEENFRRKSPLHLIKYEEKVCTTMLSPFVIF